MTHEQKDLLLKDLCARLPYGVKAEILNEEDERKQVVVSYGNICYVPELGNSWWKECKPYLFPLSSMTAEQKEELDNMFNQEDDICEKIETDNFELSFYRKSIFDFLNKYHLD